MACARKAHTVEDDGGAEACSSTPQAACRSTMTTLRPLLGVSYPWYQISSLALGRRSTPASCSRPAWSKRYDPLLRHGDADHFNPEEPREAASARAKQRNLQLVCAQREAKHA